MEEAGLKLKFRGTWSQRLKQSQWKTCLERKIERTSRRRSGYLAETDLSWVVQAGPCFGQAKCRDRGFANAARKPTFRLNI